MYTKRLSIISYISSTNSVENLFHCHIGSHDRDQIVNLALFVITIDQVQCQWSMMTWIDLTRSQSAIRQQELPANWSQIQRIRDCAAAFAHGLNWMTKLRFFSERLIN